MGGGGGHIVNENRPLMVNRPMPDGRGTIIRFEILEDHCNLFLDGTQSDCVVKPESESMNFHTNSGLGCIEIQVSRIMTPNSEGVMSRTLKIIQESVIKFRSQELDLLSRVAFEVSKSTVSRILTEESEWSQESRFENDSRSHGTVLQMTLELNARSQSHISL